MTFYRVIRDGVLMGIFIEPDRAQRYRNWLLAERREIYRAFHKLASFDEAREGQHIYVQPQEVNDIMDALAVVTKD